MFQGNDYDADVGPPGCFSNYDCSVKPLPFPGDGLKWENLQSYAVPHPYQGNAGLVPDANRLDLNHDVYFAKFINSSAPATITKKYPGTPVKAWSFSGLDFGCSAVQNVSLGPGNGYAQGVLYADCSLTIEVLNQKGQRVGSETFTSLGFQEGGSQYQQYPMESFSTAAGGLKGKKIYSLQLTGKYLAGPGKLLGDIVYGIDEVKYTLYNKTA